MTELTGLSQLFRDVFACLGISALWRHQGQETAVRLLVRQPEHWMTAGDGSFLSSYLNADEKIEDIPTTNR